MILQVFGLNGGKPSLKESYEDLNIVFYYLISILKINSKNIILMGKSIGTITTLKFASTLFPKLLKSKNSTIVIKSPTSPVESCKQYKSVGGIILLNSFGPGGLSDNIVNLLLSLDAFEHLKKVERITCPVLLIHAEEDQVVNIKSSKKLSKLFNNLFKFTRVKDAGHWNLDTHYLDDYEDDLMEFVKVVSPESFANRKERDEPASYAMSPNKVIGNWLDRMELIQYTQNFLQFGYFDMNSISTLDELLLEMIGISDQKHISTLMKEIDNINKSLYSNTSSSYSMMTISSSCSIDSSLNSNASGILSSNSSCSTTSSSSSSSSSNNSKSNNGDTPSSSTPPGSTPSRNSANLDTECTVNSSISSGSCNYCTLDECNDLDKLKE
ncbi:hypothetical protein DICPUDRAFT_98999 [Dictyostelium purpureum]|uniref:SAM domain-containing protein n=1 Tax=Dictyostelium purpureum TaxID=5786 RepID=F0ZVF8_DICPU|nr:uncharacterized protein DICPUDRAFT_98999 [Dictyostelium purpureum]EGC32080.1 hypothetical protein DICPUDRAFT_98999 [Dictyostelium purpureum]|eukprot:XP_003291403.1 hypothetical protein DICPUDRAFT_98999 [Dictyostelium purpureum]